MVPRYLGRYIHVNGTCSKFSLEERDDDRAAARALARGNSLLPAGVTGVEGNFQRGDPVIVRDADGRELARGLIAYGSADARRILGRQSGEIETILGYRGREEMIHRDDLVES